MNEDLPEVNPRRENGEWELSLSLADLRSMLTGLRPGWYVVADLYPRYLAWAEREKKPAVHPISVGISMRQLVGAGNVRVPSKGNTGRMFLLTDKHVSDSTLSTDPVG